MSFKSFSLHVQKLTRRTLQVKRDSLSIHHQTGASRDIRGGYKTMTNHPNRSKAKRITWRRENGGSLTALLPNGQEWTFSRPGGGYVYCDFGSARNHGTLGKQICYGGGLRGSTISERSDAAFERAVKKWLADYRRDDPNFEWC